MPAFTIEQVYTSSSTAACEPVTAESNELTSRIWFTTPALDADLLKRINKIQLQTFSHDQGYASFPEAGSWSWFDIAVLETPDATTPKVKDGLTLLWLSHTNSLGVGHDTRQIGDVFDRSHDIFRALEPGNAIGVRVCARFPGWQNFATSGSLDLRVADDELPLPELDEERLAKLKAINLTKDKLAKILDKYLDGATPDKADPAYSLVREMLLDGPVRADLAVPSGEPPLQILALDGGGVRGISSLTILQQILAKVTGSQNTKPCEYFHMIAGTSTGGLIAIMLGRLQLTVQQCIDAYTQLASEIFAGNDSVTTKFKLGTTGFRYGATNIENAVQNFIKSYTGDANAPMMDPDVNNQCKVFVVAGEAQNLNNYTAEHIRTYQSKLPDKFTSVPIWQAARATSAAPTYFPSITINNTPLIDGGIRYNNPSILLLGEVSQVYGLDRLATLGCFISIGTGMAPNVAIKSNPSTVFSVPGYLLSIENAATAIMTDCENTHMLLKGMFPPNVYWRFNAGVKAGDNWAKLIEMDDYQEMPKLVKITNDYLAGEAARLGQCAGRLKDLRP
ncbi:hypothetical protein HGRIS_000301 [Hohenbuehelia grisea]|uniref:PNPLA domain-containing protein n=1 Tax=Hohenbuehelia grisea TaxID=104357 RepID=A0ABR3JS81_9AGAR